jgi:hypothetical protein
VDAVEARWAPYSKCFSGDSTVIVRGSNSPVKLQELEEGDYVLDHDMKYVQVVGWLHRDETLEANFVEIRHRFGKIALTGEHLIYDPEKCDYVPAASAKSIQSIFMDGTLIDSKILNKKNKVYTGIYAPLTTSGSLLVSGVHASCYTAPESLKIPITQTLGDIATLPYRIFQTQKLLSIDTYCRCLYKIFAH